MTLDDLIDSLKKKTQSNFLIDLNRYLKQPGHTINDTDILGRTLLIYAVIEDKPQLVYLLLRKKASVDQKCDYKKTPLMYAVSTHYDCKHTIAIMDLLLKSGARINKIDMVGFTALMHAVRTANLAAVRFLVEKRADINIKSENGRTALMWAIKNVYCSKIVNYLLEQGAAIEKTDKQGNSALSIAAEGGFIDVMESLLWNGAQLPRNLKADPGCKTIFTNLLTNMAKDIKHYLPLESHCSNIVIDYLYEGWKPLGIFYSAPRIASPKRSLQASLPEERGKRFHI